MLASRPLSSRLELALNSRTHHQGDLQERRQLVLVFYGRLRVNEASLVAEGAVGAHQDLLRHRLAENLHLQRVGQDLLCFLGEGHAHMSNIWTLFCLLANHRLAALPAGATGRRSDRTEF